MARVETAGMSGTPSRCADLLRTLVNHRIVGATRYSWWTPEKAQERCRATGHAAFSLAAGALAIEFDTGLILGLGNDPASRSISVWVEQNESGQAVQSKPLASDVDLYAIAASDPVLSDEFWRRLCGSRVDRVSILVREPATAKLSKLPNEVGLCFTLDRAVKVVASYGLHDDSDNFSFIREDTIQESLRAELHEVELAPSTRYS